MSSDRATTAVRQWLCLASFVGLVHGPGLAHAADAARGQALYESRCVACHSIDDNRVGPAHRGVVGRKAGSVPGYDYSAAVKGSAIVWDPSTLDRWLTDPEKTIPGQKMGYSVPDANDRADLIAWLAANPAK